MRVSLVAAIVLALVMAFFAVQNSQPTHVTFLGWYSDGPLVIILLLTFAAGVISALLATLPGTLKKTIEISKLKSRVAEGSRKIESLEKITENNLQNIEHKNAKENGYNA
jgi:uncharacterized integral membrane protein